MTLNIRADNDYVEISGFEHEDYKYDDLVVGSSVDGKYIYLEMRHEDDKVTYYLTSDEIIRIAYELNRIAERMGRIGIGIDINEIKPIQGLT